MQPEALLIISANSIIIDLLTCLIIEFTNRYHYRTDQLMRFDITFMTFSGGLVLMDIQGRFFFIFNIMVPVKIFCIL